MTIATGAITDCEDGGSFSSSTAVARDHLIEADAAKFRLSLNRASFLFRHRLATHKLFELPQLVRLAERMLAQGQLSTFVVLGGQSASASSKISSMPAQRKLAEAVAQIADGKYWLKLSSADAADPDYKEVLDRILREIEELSGEPLHEQITWSALTVFLASPRMVTPYHIDHESNFLLQVRGEKDVSLFDQCDRSLLTEEEIEDFYIGNFEAAHYRESLQPRGTVYRLAPGLAVHNPPLGPHWVQNGDDVSISVSIGFCQRSLDRRARVYQVNRYLRRLGLKPNPPGVSRLSDGLKIRAVGLISKSNPTTPGEILLSGLDRLRAIRSKFRFGAAN